MPAKKPATAKSPPRKPATEEKPPATRAAPKRAPKKAAARPVDAKKAFGTVDALMENLEHPFKAEIEAVRRIILGANGRMSERIKWNSPSFFSGEHDFAAFHLRNTKFVHLIVVYPKDTAVIDDAGGLLEGDHKDRREAKFYGMDDVRAKRAALEKVVNDWVALAERV